jgi:hypothetical protein
MVARHAGVGISKRCRGDTFIYRMRLSGRHDRDESRIEVIKAAAPESINDFSPVEIVFSGWWWRKSKIAQAGKSLSGRGARRKSELLKGVNRYLASGRQAVSLAQAGKSKC